jgi:glyceraldehyde 3-phosphate dehydrogenase
MRIALNGLGRIGKNFLRILCKHKVPYELVAINVGPDNPEIVPHILRYDSILGRYEGPIEYTKKILRIGDHTIQIFAEPDARRLPWEQLAIDWVVDVSGRYTKREQAEQHIQAGAQSVLISAPAHGDDVTIIMGVNEQVYDAQKHKIVSLGSCTTNAVIPMLAVLNKAYTIQTVSLTTTHAYTNSQALVDRMGKGDELRSDRAAALNIIPAHTGALDVAARVIPELAGKVIGCALRVPVAIVSVIDLVVAVEQSVSQQEIHTRFIDAQKRMQGILEVTHDPVVSSDFRGSTASVTVDLGMTTSCNNIIKAIGWYDNEYAYSMRLKDFLAYVAPK